MKKKEDVEKTRDSEKHTYMQIQSYANDASELVENFQWKEKLMNVFELLTACAHPHKRKQSMYIHRRLARQYFSWHLANKIVNILRVVYLDTVTCSVGFSCLNCICVNTVNNQQLNIRHQVTYDTTNVWLLLLRVVVIVLLLYVFVVCVDKEQASTERTQHSCTHRLSVCTRI